MSIKNSYAKTKITIISLLAFFGLDINAYAGMQCQNQQNSPVDWWVILKIPRNATPATSGYGYMYFDPTHTTGTLYINNQELNSPQQALGYTLTQIYNAKSTDTAWLMYNDEFPAQQFVESQEYGHMKGVISFDNTSGFWLIHSAPSFPEPVIANQQYFYPDSEAIYGQSMLCISLSTTDKFGQINNIGKQLEYSDPDVYDANIPQTFASNIPDFVNAANHTNIVKTPGDSTIPFTSLNGVKFVSTVQSSPSSGSNSDFYQYVANNQLARNLLVQSWLRTGGTLGPACNMTYTANDVSSVLTPSTLGSYAWTTSLDHSKWAISQSGTDSVCIGDLNRVASQLTRGGGTMCFGNKNIHDIMFNMITSSTTCSTT